jgi:predicted dehydrogenase
MNPQNRRTFLKTSALASAGLVLSAKSWGQVTNANSDIRIAVIGINSRGKSHIASIKKAKGARLVAVCDVDSAVLAHTLQSLGSGVKGYSDLRDLFNDKEVDAVTIATPNHWHSLAAIWACQAGKDVYVEKPVSHNIWEGRQLVSAAAKYNRIVQAGTQIRSGEGLREAVDWIQAGNLGKITVARGFCYKYRGSIGKTSGAQPIPQSVNYDLWSGPAAKEELHRKRLHYDWHWHYETGNGDVGNQGIHQMDVARWFLGETGLPRHTLSVGGRLGYVDDGNTPNTQVVIHDYATAPLVFEVRGLPGKKVGSGNGDDSGSAEAAEARASLMDKYKGASIGNVIDCEGGYLVTSEYFTATAFDKSGKVIKHFKGSDRHMQNFVDVVKSRKSSDQYGPVLDGHVSSALCHLGNISHQLGKVASPDSVKEALSSNPVLGEAFSRMAKHMKLNEVKLQETPLYLGASLDVDTANEGFINNEAATAMLKRAYRGSYVVPQIA